MSFKQLLSEDEEKHFREDGEGGAAANNASSQPPPPHPNLSLCRKLLFGLAAPPLQMTSNICGFFFSIYLLEAVHLSPAQVSLITFSGRVWDAVTDPMVGQLVLRTRTRCGRTKPWLVAATLFGPASFLAMWLSPAGLPAGLGQFLYHFLCYLAYCGLITCYHVPYASSTMLISDSSRDKDGATACRIGCELLFTILGAGLFGTVISRHRLAADCNSSDAADAAGGRPSPTRMIEERRGYALGALIISGIYFANGLFAIFGIRERVKLDRRRDSLLGNVRAVLAFRPYVLLMLAFLFMSLAIQTVQANLGLYTTHSIDMGSHMNAGILTVLSVAALLVPFWSTMCNRFGKKPVFLVGLVPMLPCLMLATVLHPGSVAAYYAVTAASGASISVAMLLPWSMLPDVIDDFYCRTGERKEATFYSLYVFFTKFASGLSLALSQLVLGAAGYDTDSCEQPYSVAIALRYLVGPGPIVCVCLAMLIMHFYPIDAAYREALSRRLVDKLYSSYGTAESVRQNSPPPRSNNKDTDEEGAVAFSGPRDRASLFEKVHWSRPDSSTELLLENEDAVSGTTC